DGGKYRGWQRQGATQHTVQEVIEETLSRLFKKSLSAYGCGRTDAGVHASQYVIQINLDEALSFDLKFRMNKNLPEGIAVYEIFEVNPNHHCRHDATARTYDYFLHWNKDPGLICYSSFYEGLKLDFKQMQKAVILISETTDFRSLCKQPDLYQHTFCDIMNCELFMNEEQGRMRFTITANRFLRGMVRYCVYYLLEVGTGNLTLEEFSKVLKQESEITDKRPAHPNGLFLSKVEYPFIQFKDSHNLIKLLKNGLE
ncbi:MAG: tRNA pseudouridine synthase A, partial [Flavobacteriales bacterium]